MQASRQRVVVARVEAAAAVSSTASALRFRFRSRHIWCSRSAQFSLWSCGKCSPAIASGNSHGSRGRDGMNSQRDQPSTRAGSGCDRPFKPDTSSYDYDAPISEAGWTTDKFQRTRELLARYLLPGETLPEPPARNPLITFAPVAATEAAPVLENLPPALADDQPRSMEEYGQGYGCILYRTTIPAGPAGALEAAAVRDFGFVFVDGSRVGVFDRRTSAAMVRLPARGG